MPDFQFSAAFTRSVAGSAWLAVQTGACAFTRRPGPRGRGQETRDKNMRNPEKQANGFRGSLRGFLGILSYSYVVYVSYPKKNITSQRRRVSDMIYCIYSFSKCCCEFRFASGFDQRRRLWTLVSWDCGQVCTRPHGSKLAVLASTWRYMPVIQLCTRMEMELESKFPLDSETISLDCEAACVIGNVPRWLRRRGACRFTY